MRSLDPLPAPGSAGRRKRAPAIVGWIALAILIGAALAINMLVGHARTIAWHVDADSLWAFAFLHDIFADHARIADWNFGQHADFFPDRFFSAASYALTESPEDWLFGFGAFDTLFFFAIAWYCLYLHRRAVRGATGAVQIGLLAAILATLLPLFVRSWGLFERFLHAVGAPSGHFGPSFGGILAAVIAIDCFGRAPRPASVARLGVAAVLLFLCAISDKLTIVVVVPPFLTAVLYFAAVRRPVGWMVPVAALSLMGAAGAAYGLHDPLWNHVADISPVQSVLRLDTFIPQAGILARTVFPPDSPVQSILAALLVAGVLLLAGVTVARALGALRGLPVPADRATADTMIAYLVATAILNPVAILALGQFYSPALARYVFPGGYCAVLALAAALAEMIPSRWPPVRVGLATAAICIALSIVPLQISGPLLPRAAILPLTRCLDAFSQENNLGMGLGNHWDTYRVNFWSKRHIVVRFVNGVAEIAHWIDNLEWYAPRTDGKLFNFVVAEGNIDLPGLRALIGPPARVLDCRSLGAGYGEKQIWVFPRPAAERLTAMINDQYRRLKAQR